MNRKHGEYLTDGSLETLVARDGGKITDWDTADVVLPMTKSCRRQ